MKAYGVPRDKDVENPDLLDIKLYGLKSSSGRLVGKGGDIKNSFRNVKSKAASRRIWKKKARSAQKVDIRTATDY